MTKDTLKMQATEIRDEISKFEDARAVLAMQINHADGENLVRLNKDIEMVNAKLVQLQQELNELLNAEMDQQANEPERISEQPDTYPLTEEDFTPLFNAGVEAAKKQIRKDKLKKAAITGCAIVGTAAIAVAVGHVACLGAFLLTKRGIAAHLTGLAAASVTGAVLGHQAIKHAHAHSEFVNPE